MKIFRIAYVEDNDYLRETIGMLMEAEDREISLHADAESALAETARRKVDLVITDVSLPGLSGTELTRQLVQRDPDACVVLCSGFAFGAELRTLGRNVRSLSKPFEPDDLEALIAEIVAGRR